MSIWGLLRGRRGNGHSDPASVTVVAPERKEDSPIVRAIFIVLLFGCLYVGRQLFVPIALAILFALILSPGVRALARWRLPPSVGAGIVLALFVGFLAVGGYLLSGPVHAWAEKAPETRERISEMVVRMTKPFRKLMGKDVPHPAELSPNAPLKVEVKQPTLLRRVIPQAGNVLGVAGTTFILLYFLLASGDRLLASIFSNILDVSKRVQAISIGNDIKEHVSKYLSVITMINVVEGGLIATGLWLAGMPTPILWGALHSVLNFVPYVGAITGLAITSLVAIVSFETIPRMILPPAIYFAVMFLDNFTSPLILGNRLVLNPIIVFVSLMFWGWLWGLAGVLIAIPMLISTKIVCDHIPRLQEYGRIISGEVVNH